MKKKGDTNMCPTTRARKVATKAVRRKRVLNRWRSISRLEKSAKAKLSNSPAVLCRYVATTQRWSPRPALAMRFRWVKLYIG